MSFIEIVAPQNIKIHSDSEPQIITIHPDSNPKPQIIEYQGRKISRTTCEELYVLIFKCCYIFRCCPWSAPCSPCSRFEEQQDFYQGLTQNDNDGIEKAINAFRNGAEPSWIKADQIVQLAKDNKRLALDFLWKQCSGFKIREYVRYESVFDGTRRRLHRVVDRVERDPLMDPILRAFRVLYYNAGRTLPNAPITDHQTYIAFKNPSETLCLLCDIHARNFKYTSFEAVSEVEKRNLSFFFKSDALKKVLYDAGWKWILSQKEFEVP